MDTLTPTAVATLHTAEFIFRNLPASECRILEIGCGSGHLAACLKNNPKLSLVALDSDPKAIPEARSRGVDARLAVWPDFDDNLFDAILFTRSLHHIANLGPALDRAKALLKPDGILIVDDFAWETMSNDSINWFVELLREINRDQKLIRTSESFGAKLLSSSNALNEWRAEHEVELHTSKQMLSAIHSRFKNVQTEQTAYCFRYAIPLVTNDKSGAQIIETIKARELTILSQNTSPALGWRATAKLS